MELHRDDDFTLTTDPARIDIDLVYRYIAGESYWSRGIPRDRLERAIRNSLCFGIYQGAGQVGFARVVTDRATFAWLGDVFILDEFRGRGLGKWMIASIARHPDLDGLRRWFLATRDAHGLYEQFGWRPLEDPGKFMEIFRPYVIDAG